MRKITSKKEKEDGGQDVAMKGIPGCVEKPFPAKGNPLKRLSCVFMITAMTACFHNGFGQQTIDARSSGMAFSNGAVTRGLEHVGLNPATLALAQPFRYELNLFSANAYAFNNSFSKTQYDRYFTTGRLLSAEDLDDIFNSIPESGLRADGSAKVNTLAFYTRYFSISLVGLGLGFAKAPKAAFDLPIQGNIGNGRVYRFDDSDGDRLFGGAVLISGAYPLHSDNRGVLNLAALGLTAKYIFGFDYDGIAQVRGEIQDYDLVNHNPYVRVNGNAELISSDGGRGYGIDLGALLQFRQKWTVGLTLLNLAGKISWDDNTEQRMVTLRADSLTLPDRFDDQELIDSDTTIAIRTFSTGLPMVVDVAFGYQWTPDVLLTVEYEQGLDDDIGGASNTRLAMGFEYSGIPVLPIRSGLTFGGRPGSAFALGVGLNLNSWYLDIAYVSQKSLIPTNSVKGVTLALTTRLRF